MDRRDGSRNRRETAPSPVQVAFWAVLAASAGKPVFTADRYVEDPLNLGFVWRFVDWNDPTHFLEQSTPANQVAIPAPHADYRGLLCANFTGVETYVSNRAAIAFEFLHDGTGCSLFFGFTPTTVVGVHALVCTTSSAGSARGISLYANAALARNAASTSAAALYGDVSAGAIASGTPTYREVSHGTGRAPQFDVRAKGTIANSGAYAVAAEAGAPSHTLRLGSNAGLTVPYVGRWRDLILTPGVDSAQRAAIQNYYQVAYGIAA